MPISAMHGAAIPVPRMARRIPAMQAMQLLASGGVTMAAGAMISLSLAVSPPITLVPPRPVPVDVNDMPPRPVSVNDNVTSQQHRLIETVGAAIANDFERRWQATDDMPLMPMPHRNPLEGLIGGTQIGPHDLAVAAQPEQRESVKVVQNEPPARPTDVCARHGLRRVDYTQNRHRYWRCAGRR
jgi:hypothetical protein